MEIKITSVRCDCLISYNYIILIYIIIMSEGGGNYYKKFGGLDDNFHNQTIFIDNLVSKSLTSATVPINLPENLKLWIKSDTDDLSGLVEVRNDLGYTINTTLIDESKGDLVGNGSRLTGAAIDDTEFNHNLWPVKQNASIGGFSAVNRNLKTVEISGSLVHGEVGSVNASKIQLNLTLILMFTELFAVFQAITHM